MGGGGSSAFTRTSAIFYLFSMGIFSAFALPAAKQVLARDFLGFRGNLWEAMARSSSQDSFCLSKHLAASDLLTTCLIPMCLTSEELSSFHTVSFTSSIDGADVYRDYLRWGNTSLVAPLGSVNMRTPRAVSQSNICIRYTGCVSSPLCSKYGTNLKLNCDLYMEMPHSDSYVQLPPGYFLTCGSTTLSYVPPYLFHGTECCLSKLAVILPTKHHLKNLAHTHQKRGLTLDSSCDSTISLLNQAQQLSLAISLIGVPALAAKNSKNLNALTCWTMKNVNATSRALGLLNSEQSELREAVLHHRAALDYLMLVHKKGCNEISEMCCFDIEDNKKKIDKEIDTMNASMNDVTVQTSFLQGFWNSLWNWLPDMHWLKVIIQIIVIGFAVCIMLCLCVQCIPLLFRMMPAGCPKFRSGLDRRQLAMELRELSHI